MVIKDIYIYIYIILLFIYLENNNKTKHATLARIIRNFVYTRSALKEMSIQLVKHCFRILLLTLPCKVGNRLYKLMSKPSTLEGCMHIITLWQNHLF